MLNNHRNELAIAIQFVLYLLAFSINGCGSTQQATNDTNDDILIKIDDQNRIFFRGNITNETAEQVINLYEEAEEKPDVLLISSRGGPVEAGLDLAEWIMDNDIHVEVGAGCASSCANYIFPAGHTKRLSRNSILIWHGSAWQKSFDDRTDPNSDDYDPLIVKLREREVEFFSALGVDNILTVYGQKTGVGVRAWLRLVFRGVQNQGFDYSLDDLKRMGLDNIVLLDGEWNWRDYREDFEPLVRRVSLPDDYEFQLNRFGAKPE